jgi:hypothetical protein
MEIIKAIKLLDANLVSSNIAENDFPVFNLGTTYGLGDKVIYVATNVHEIYQSVIAGNVGQSLTDTTKWVKVGTTNRFRMFDDSITSQTSGVNVIDFTLGNLTRTSAVWLGNIDATTVQVIITSPTNVTMYDQTFTTVKPSGVVGWHTYFFGEKSRIRDLYIPDLPYQSGETIRIILTKVGTPKCGACVVGQARYIGETRNSLKMGIDDYSVKEIDEFGNTYIKQRDYRKFNDVEIDVPNTSIDEVSEILSDLRASFVVFIGSRKYALSQVYGFYQNFEIVIPYKTHSVLSISIKGIT